MALGVCRRLAGPAVVGFRPSGRASDGAAPSGMGVAGGRPRLWMPEAGRRRDRKARRPLMGPRDGHGRHGGSPSGDGVAVGAFGRRLRVGCDGCGDAPPVPGASAARCGVGGHRRRGGMGVAALECGHARVQAEGWHGIPVGAYHECLPRGRVAAAGVAEPVTGHELGGVRDDPTGGRFADASRPAPVQRGRGRRGAGGAVHESGVSAEVGAGEASWSNPWAAYAGWRAPLDGS